MERELANYPHPLPSREYILQILGEQEGVPVSFERLCELLDVALFERELFLRRLGAMARDGQLLQNRRNDWLIPDKANLIRGRVQGHADGFGFLIPEVEPGKRPDKANDIFLSPKEMEKVLHGDKAIVRVVGVDRRGRPEGKIVEVTEHTNTRVVGRVFEEHGVWFVVAENRRISQDILIAPPQKGDKRTLMPKVGQVVMAEILEQPSKQSQPIGRVVEVLGNYADPGMEIEIALRKHELPYEFSDEAQAQTVKLPDVVRKTDWKGREDITKLPLVTIDGETARDFDDAVYCERQGKGYRLIVAIADVSHYVNAGSALDSDAYDRGNSVYFPRRVIPMLPEKLSNGLCSLNPQVERLCMVCDMDISNTGAVKRYRFYPAVMFSHARLTYTEVAAALYEGDAAMRKKLAPQLPNLEALDALFRLLAEARGKRGAIDFDTAETRMVFDDNGKISRIEPYERNDAHRLIEECMLAANVCASEFLHEHEHPVLYRIHEGPTPEKLAKLRDFLGTFGLQLGGGEEPHAKDYAKLMEKIVGRPDKALLQTVMLRSLRQAVYSPDNVGHFGLAYESYTHFTSPIRRYPDLMVHRAIKAVLAKKPYVPGDWADIGLHCSMTERRADDATRDVEAWLKCFYMQDRVGEEFDGSISSVVPFGIFVALDDVFIEGLVHVSELGRDYFHFDEAQHAMMGERTGVRYRLSDRVRVQLVRVDMETNKIDFRLVMGAVEAPAIHKPSQPVETAVPAKLVKATKIEKPAKVKAKKAAKKAAPAPVETALPMVSPKAQLQPVVQSAAEPFVESFVPGKKSGKKPRAALLGGQRIPLPEVSVAPKVEVAPVRAKKAATKAAPEKAVSKASVKPKAKTVAKKAAPKTATKAAPKKVATAKQAAAPKKVSLAKKAAAPQTAPKKTAAKAPAKKASSGKSTARKA
ncbi:MAG TPA: ribonuclease R [Rhodocyclaceae bacterium]|nr:ribonuclease R [Rhodocyclaceae bacterium]